MDEQQRDRAMVALSKFILNAPEGAKKLAVRVRAHSPGEVADTLMLLDVARCIELGAGDVARDVYKQTESWAEGQGRECSFTAHHVDEQDKPLVGHLWRIETGPLAGEGVRFDGSSTSALAQSQQHTHTILSQYLQGIDVMQRSYKAVIDMQARRISELEAQRDSLEKRARNADETEAELAVMTLEADRQKDLLGLGERLLEMLKRNAQPANAGAAPPASAATATTAAPDTKALTE